MMNRRDYNCLESAISRVNSEFADLLQLVDTLMPNRYDNLMAEFKICAEMTRTIRLEAREGVTR